jgi:hypothetical protein
MTIFYGLCLPLDVGDIQSRLIDHRPVIQGEIRYFVREFEVNIQLGKMHRNIMGHTM